VKDIRTRSDHSDDVPAPEPVAGAEGLAERLSALEAELLRAQDAHLRAEADLQNARRRAGKDLDEAERRGEARAFGSYLALLDDLTRALEAASVAGESGPLVDGVRLVLTRAADELARLGVVAIDPLGRPFDPREHEALLAAPSDTHAAGHVAQVVSPGYRQGERLLRPARVIVSDGPAPRAPGREADPEPGS
jgi:molecular chaperone GrpE